MPPSPRIAAVARDAILDWYGSRGRPLAFRHTTDPWAILVSEAMAQQTQAARAAAYWERFMARFPTSAAVAAASPADVLRAWQGLGYDRRALALRRAAIVIETEHGGQVPSTVETLLTLPGVGPYTARAVAALAFGLPVGAVDVNVRRVLGRIAAGGSDGLGPAALQSLADAAVPRDRPGEWTHAVMDIGATLCKPRRPDCPSCPARAWCAFAVAKVDDDRSGATPAAPAVRATRESATPFASTTRWLRGRILDRLRAAPDGAWVELGGAIGTHEPAAVGAAVSRMAIDGLLELEPSAAQGTRVAPLRARLPLS